MMSAVISSADSTPSWEGRKENKIYIYGGRMLLNIFGNALLQVLLHVPCPPHRLPLGRLSSHKPASVGVLAK